MPISADSGPAIRASRFRGNARTAVMRGFIRRGSSTKAIGRSVGSRP